MVGVHGSTWYPKGYISLGLENQLHSSFVKSLIKKSSEVSKGQN
jgi:hypothetical protein